MEKYTMSMDWKNQYCENKYSTQSNLEIHCNSYQATNGIFRKLDKYFHNWYGNTHTHTKPQIDKVISRTKMEMEESTCLSSDDGTMLQSSRECGTGTKTEI